MKLLLDSANLNEIHEAMRSTAIAGVTTNPSLVAREPSAPRSHFKGYIDLLRNILAEVKGSDKHLSLEVVTLDPDWMIEQAVQLKKELFSDDFTRWPPFYVKVPVLPETLRVITELRERVIRVNATACMTSLQAKLASDAGADIVSFFYGRMRDWEKGCSANWTREKALREISEYRNWLEKGGASAKIICGSIRTPEDVQDCWNAGAHFVTTSAKVIKQCVEHGQTRQSVEGFQKDIEQWLA